MATACITGASSGIGREIAKILGSMGYDLVLVARNKDQLQALAHEIEADSKKNRRKYLRNSLRIESRNNFSNNKNFSNNSKRASKPDIHCEIYTCDLSDEDSCLKLSEYLKTVSLSVLVNNAGFGELSNFTGGMLQHQIDMINVNIKAVHILTHELLPLFIEQDQGYLLNVASSAGLMPGGPYMSVYYATKAYVASLTSSIAQELKDLKSHVHVSMLCPGPVDTRFNSSAGVKNALPGISAKCCASYAVKKMFSGKVIIVPAFTIKAAVVLIRLLPRPLAVAMTGHQQKKKGI